MCAGTKQMGGGLSKKVGEKMVLAIVEVKKRK